MITLEKSAGRTNASHSPWLGRAGARGDVQALLEQGDELLLTHALAPARQRRAIEHQPVLEELLAAEVLVIGVLDPALAQHLIGQVIAVLEDRQPRHQPCRQRRVAGIVGTVPKRWRTTTIPDPHAGARADLIGRAFGPDPAAADTRWCGDITYIRTWQGWAYLATVIDIATRRVVGWALADHLRTDLVADALRQAVAARRPPAGVIFHADRGCQYTSAQFASLAQELGVRLSVGRTGQCWDNALAESFFATIKGELIHRRPWPTRAVLRARIFDYIEGWYNTRRRHSALGYLSPAVYENTAALRAA